MSSHREAPEISKDPVADSTDLYAFVSPDRPDTVTILANYIPLQDPAGGPNFFEFGDDVRYEIHVSHRGDARADITYRFEFRTTVRNPDTFLYNTGRITSLSDPAFNRPQQYTVTRIDRSGRSRVLARHVPVPPCNIGFRSTPDYDRLAASAVHELAGGGLVFAGQRADGFYVDLGSVFDLLTLRPFQAAHLVPSAAAAGVDTLRGVNVHTLALQLPITHLTRHGVHPAGPLDPAATIGVWTSASRRRFRVTDDDGDVRGIGRWQQVSRLANPLVNEVLIPMGRKDEWNAARPETDRRFAQYVRRPEAAGLLPVLYPGAFGNLAALDEDRDDLVAIFLTGLPEGVVPGFQNHTGPRLADLLRLNVAVPPATSPNRLGLVAGDPAGFPNGRRVMDDVVTVELRALAGLTYPLVAPGYTPDAVASQITDGTVPRTFRPTFPYLDTPAAGYDVPAA
ncbi:MAG: DUF4331 domain-containing protein [Kineosporiaceae bacterium]